MISQEIRDQVSYYETSLNFDRNQIYFIVDSDKAAKLALILSEQLNCLGTIDFSNKHWTEKLKIAKDNLLKWSVMIDGATLRDKSVMIYDLILKEEFPVKITEVQHFFKYPSDFYSKLLEDFNV